jgi:hypothetical protein
MPNTDIDDPIRAKARKERDDPKCTKSMTENEAHMSSLPTTDNVDPTRTKLRSDIELPTTHEESTASDDPIREHDLRDKEAPK